MTNLKLFSAAELEDLAGALRAGAWPVRIDSLFAACLFPNRSDNEIFDPPAKFAAQLIAEGGGNAALANQVEQARRHKKRGRPSKRLRNIVIAVRLALGNSQREGHRQFFMSDADVNSSNIAKLKKRADMDAKSEAIKTYNELIKMKETAIGYYLKQVDKSEQLSQTAKDAASNEAYLALAEKARNRALQTQSRMEANDIVGFTATGDEKLLAHSKEAYSKTLREGHTFIFSTPESTD